MKWLKLPAWKIGERGFEPRSGIHVLKKQNVISTLNILGSLRDREVACSASGAAPPVNVCDIIFHSMCEFLFFKILLDR